MKNRTTKHRRPSPVSCQAKRSSTADFFPRMKNESSTRNIKPNAHQQQIVSLVWMQELNKKHQAKCSSTSDKMPIKKGNSNSSRRSNSRSRSRNSSLCGWRKIWNPSRQITLSEKKRKAKIRHNRSKAIQENYYISTYSKQHKKFLVKTEKIKIIYIFFFLEIKRQYLLRQFSND